MADKKNTFRLIINKKNNKFSLYIENDAKNMIFSFEKIIQI